jgi:hypothetical protein
MKEVAKINKGEVTTPGSPRLGFEEPIDQGDLIIPRAKLFQGTPTEADEYPDAKGGQVINSLTKEVLPSVFVPVFKFTEVVKFNGRNQKDPDFNPAYAPGALIWKVTDPQDPRWAEGDFGPNGEKPLAMRTLRFLSYFPGVQMPVIVSFAKTSYRAGKQLLSLAQFTPGNMFDRRYRLGTKKEESDGNTYHVFTVALDGISTDEERTIALDWYKALRGKALKVHEDDVGSTE